MRSQIVRLADFDQDSYEFLLTPLTTATACP